MKTLKRTVTSPKATALWLVNNTSLTFKQIADFCSLHLMEVKSIADGVMASGLREKNPILHNELTEDEILKCEENPEKALQISHFNLDEELKINIKKKSYVSVSKRQNKPSAALWLVKNIPNITHKEIRAITGATKKVIDSITENTSTEIIPKDPVSLGLCTQTQLNALIEAVKSRSSEK